jgi:SnoaL-like protein
MAAHHDGLEATQYQLSSILVDVDGDEARASANVVGVHSLTNSHGAPLWTVGGAYDFRLVRTGDGWRIRAITMTVTGAQGNQHVLPLALARSAGATPARRDAG